MQPNTTNSRNPYKVFISSTYLDNAERRKLVQDAIISAGMVWHGMEIFTANTRPVKEVCLQFANEADILVGIISSRYGWTPDGDKSITEMEYDVAKKRLMFIIDPSTPVIPEKDFDFGKDKWSKQEKLEKFKNKIKKEQMVATFNDKTLQKKVVEALNLWRKQQENIMGDSKPVYKTEHPSESNSSPDKTILDYCKKAESYHESIPVAGFVTQLKVPIDIEDIYVPLRAMVDLRGVREERFTNSDDAKGLLNEPSDGLEISLPKAFNQVRQRNQRGVVILGDPGSGKTTHLKRLLLYCLRNGSQEIGLPEHVLPIFLPLRDLTDLNSGLDTFIERQLADPLLKTPKGFGKKLLERGNLLLLLDGLDEVADLKQREEVTNWIVKALKAHPDYWFAVTCRFAGYSNTVRFSEQFLELHIRPFSADQAEIFIRNWYHIVEKGLARDPEQAGGIAREKANKLIKRLNESDFRSSRVLELTRNPLLLANICLVHRHRGALPQKRARLYEECVDVLLEHWREAKGLSVGVNAQNGRKALQPAALWLHGEDGRTKANAEELTPHIAPVLKVINWQGKSVEEFLRTIRDQSGLLTGWDTDQYGFMHLAFQEYLAAREIRKRAFDEPGVLIELASKFGDSWWREVGLLLLSLDEPSLFKPYMREVVKQVTFAKNSELVDACIEDSAELSPIPFVELLKISPDNDEELWERQLEALRILKRLDPAAVENLKPILNEHPMIAIRERVFESVKIKDVKMTEEKLGNYKLVRIPGGEFMMGSLETEEGRRENEGPLHKVTVPDFYMGIYPVTNEEYGLFLNENSDAKEPKFWADNKYNRSKQPIVGIDWYEAKRYAEWAGLRLPSEAEWEYACRAKTITRFYSGDSDSDLDKVGWYSENSNFKLHPVGEKLANKFGIYDMHGNVWEWVEDSWHGDYEGAPCNGRDWGDKKVVSNRVVRGGGWDGDARHCRSAVRYDGSPYNRLDFLGFRLSRSVSLGT